MPTATKTVPARLSRGGSVDECRATPSRLTKAKAHPIGRTRPPPDWGEGCVRAAPRTIAKRRTTRRRRKTRSGTDRSGGIPCFAVTWRLIHPRGYITQPFGHGSEFERTRSLCSAPSPRPVDSGGRRRERSRFAQSSAGVATSPRPSGWNDSKWTTSSTGRRNFRSASSSSASSAG